MSRRSRAFVLLIGVAAVALGGLINVVDPGSTTRILAIRLVGAVFLIMAPGSLLVAALFGGTRANVADLTLLVPSLGIAVLTLGGVLLNISPFGLTGAAWVAYLVVTSTVLWWYVRRQMRRRPPDRLPSARLGRQMAHCYALRAKDGAMIGAGLAIVGLTLALANFGAEIHPRPGFTALWLVPARGDPSAVEIGIRSGENETTTYAIRLSAGPAIIGEWGDVTLVPGAMWRLSVSLPGPATSVRPLVATITRSDAPTVIYRRVVLRDVGG